ncbi:MAG: Gfo/Idh/MocA family oxidoreductase [Gorillibacterium sp.]|nr:Gfo/Idh/MocA family oxidoreductase [Gorillibacterium sp.]
MYYMGEYVNNGYDKGTHIPAIQQLPKLELAAISTSRMESAEKSAREFNAAHAFVDANEYELSQHPDVDMVVVSVKVMEHYDAIKAVVTVGKHVYCFFSAPSMGAI